MAMIEDRFRTGKSYTVSQAARLARVSPGTVRNWFYGYKERRDLTRQEQPQKPVFGTAVPSRGYEMKPLFGQKERPEEGALLSFLELSELIVAARFRKVGIKLYRIQDAHEFARTEWDLLYPFAHLNLKSIGGHLLAKFEEEMPGPGKFVVLSEPNQYILQPLVEQELSQFDYNPDDRFASRWYPHGREVPVVVDPHYAAGRPTIAGSGVSVDIVRKRWKAGERVGYIAHDFRLRRADVEAALQHVA